MKPIWTKYYPSGVGHAAFISVVKDGNLIFGSDTLIERLAGTLYKSRKQLFKIDTNGSILWRKIHDEIGGGNHYGILIEDKKHEIFALGRREPLFGIHFTLTKLT
jgi:hypothetical protein